MVKVTSPENDKYAETTKTANLNVPHVTDYDFSISTNNIRVGSDAVLTINLPSNAQDL